MEFNDRTQEDVLERLAYAEQLVVELKEIIKEKDIQLQQKDEVLQVPWFFSFLGRLLVKDSYNIHVDFSFQLDIGECDSYFPNIIK